MVTLAFMSNQGVITKKKINPENFNMSKSQFYNLFSKIKKDKIFTEKKEQLIVNQEKISTQLKDFFLGECK